MPTVTRFAPSPTGRLHLGHAHSALDGFRRARAAPGGRFLLRIEDIDATRCRPEHAEAILADLAWLGIAWDGLRVQSRHFDDYRATLRGLEARGLTYPCFCTRAAILALSAPHGLEQEREHGPLYPGTCRDMPAAERVRRVASGEAFATRLHMARALAETGPLSFHEEGRGAIECDPASFGDVVLARRDAPCGYHLCVTHDDAAQGVTLVTRGVDLLPATSVHRVIQALMDWPAPAYAHHLLLTDPGGRRLAKRDQGATLASLRQSGCSPAEVRAKAGFPD